MHSPARCWHLHHMHRTAGDVTLAGANGASTHQESTAYTAYNPARLCYDQEAGCSPHYLNHSPGFTAHWPYQGAKLPVGSQKQGWVALQGREVAVQTVCKEQGLLQGLLQFTMKTGVHARCAKRYASHHDGSSISRD
jgi:hypothetical protein